MNETRQTNAHRPVTIRSRTSAIRYLLSSGDTLVLDINIKTVGIRLQEDGQPVRDQLGNELYDLELSPMKLTIEKAKRR